MSHKVHCVICNKEFLADTEHIGVSNSVNHKRYFTSSEFGVSFYFEDNNMYRWFCNECWREIRK